jgi:polyphosphate kinase
VLFPVESKALRQRLHEECVAPALADNTSAYDMRSDGSYVRRAPAAPGEPERSAQALAFEAVLRRAMRVVAPEAPRPSPAT